MGDSCDEFKENSDNIFYAVNSFSSESNGIKDPLHALKGWESNTKGSKGTLPQMSSRKIPEAVFAFAQAAAKATGEPEKSNLPGWPLLSPSKTQLQKCDKCSREFCSSINFRRHRRVHRRSLNVDKDSQKSRDLLGTFWDKLSVDEAKELVSLRNATVEEVTGSSVIKALSTWFRRAGLLSSLPQGYIKAGLTLLDIVQASPSISPISSQELFSVLDEASEKTFLCAGTALSLQKYVFDGEVVKKALEIRNIVACASFLIEIVLVKAWLVDQDAEALRCQKLLVDEEDAAQKRQAELLERKRLKKLRQKEQKVSETSNGGKVDSKGHSVDSPPDRMGSTEVSSSRDSSIDFTSEESHNHEHPLDFMESSAADDDKNTDQSGSRNVQKEDQNTSDSACCSDDAEQNVIHQTRGTGQMQPNHSRHVHSKTAQIIPNGFQAGLVSASSRSSVNIRHNSSRDSKAISRPNNHKVWTIKSRPESEDGRYGELASQPSVSDRVEVLIGSINVSLRDGDLLHPNTISESQRQEKLELAKPDSNLNSVSKSPTKLWRPVSRHGDGNSIEIDHGDVKPGISATKDAERLLPDGSCPAFDKIVSDCESCGGGPMMFSSEAAKAFLALRWKEAIAGDQVLVISSPETDASGGPNPIEGNFANSPLQTSDFHGRHVLGRVENRLVGTGVNDPATTGSWHFKFRPKAEKTSRLKYVPKQKS
ncbi:uncharacterized protein LOC110033334 isoform X2 [Phalaenopsis equestris]|nr:uncharacterized protein LOC110033334 isoform X2 [Phalaenopsis equestris]XP_020592942.1 uncharacterized protein LOC110033334 isoform X2 [Phalaenopsis equestris]